MEKPISDNALILRDFHAVLGAYVSITATNESLFLAFLKLALLDEGDSPYVIWHQFQSTRARLEMVRNICRTKFPDHFVTVSAFIERFRGLTRQRNFYCHSIYYTREDGSHALQGVEIKDDPDVVKTTNRTIKKSTINEISNSIDLLNALNSDMWQFIATFQDELVSSGRLREKIIDIALRRHT